VPVKTTIWPIEPHTSIKHAILRRYLEAWLPIVGSWSAKLVYIDGFAGPGHYERGEEGSPLIAVKTVLGHPAFKGRGTDVIFVFIEENRERADSLTAGLAGLGKLPSWITVQPVRVGTFAKHVGAILDELDAKGLKLAPTFAFIDPFGFAVPMELIRRIAKHPACECLISFMYESVNRFLGRPDLEDNFDQLFATKDWRPIAALADPAERQRQLVALYRQQLISYAGFKHVHSFEMIDAGNRTEYHLFFGTNSDKGLSVMKQAMWKVDPIGGQRFSDRTADQLTLLNPDDDLLRLRAMLQRHFRPKGFVLIEDVERYVLLETPYSEKMHLKKRTLKPMEMSSPTLILVRKPAGASKARGQYPAGTKIRFV